MEKVVFYHAGCPVCLDAEARIAELIDNTKFEIENIHFADHKEKIAEAEALGLKSVPALLWEGHILHINFGASIEDVKKAVGLEAL